MGAIRKIGQHLFSLWCVLLSFSAFAVDVANFVPVIGGLENLGADGSETTSIPFRVAMKNAGSPSTNYLSVALPSKTWVAAGAFYSPAYSAATVIQSKARFYLVSCYVTRAATLEATLYSHDPTTGANTVVGSAVTATASKACSSTGQLTFSFNNSQLSIPSGHRLKVVVRAYQSGTTSASVRIYDGSAGTNSVLTVVEGAGSQIGNCLAAGTYNSSWGVLRVFGSDGKPRIDYDQGESITLQFAGYQTFGAISHTKSNLFAAVKSSTAVTSASSKTLNANGTLYSATMTAPAISGAFYSYIRDISDSKPLARTFFNVQPNDDSLKFYSDPAYSVQTDTFAATDTVYAVLSSPSLAFTSRKYLRIYDFNNAYSSITPVTESYGNGIVKFSFVPGTRLANGDWGTVLFQTSQSNTSGKVRNYHRNIRRLDSGCSYSPVTAPFDVSVSGRTASSVTLVWTPDFVGNASYRIYRNGVLIASNVVAGTFTDNSLSQGTIYVYTVRGVNGTYESADSNAVNAETLSNPGAFSARDCGTGTCGNARSDGTDPRIDNRLRTKIAGTAFDVEITAKEVGFNKWSQVTAELWDATDATGTLDSASNCFSSYRKISATPVALTTKNGKPVATFSVADAYRKVVVKANFSGTPASSGCSVDQFAIRPASFASVSVKDNDWLTAGSLRALNNTSATAGTIHRAGRPFSISAVAVNSAAVTTSRYDGNPVAVISNLLQPTGCADCEAGDLDVGTWSLAAGVLSSNDASYNEVGSFAMTLEDKTFAAVDASDGTTQAELTISSATTNVGRFVPDAYDVTSDGTAPVLEAGCTGAAFLGQPMRFATLPQITATPKSADGSGINNLTGSLARTASNLTASVTWLPTPGAGAINIPSVKEDTPDNPGAYLVTLNPADTLGYMRPALPAVGPFCINNDATGACATLSRQSLTLDVAVQDKYTDGTVSGSLKDTGGVINSTTISPAGSPLYFGRLALFSPIGTELVSLPIKAEVQTWDGGQFKAFSGTCGAPVFSAGQVAVSFPVNAKNKLNSCADTRLSMPGGLSSFAMTAPGAGKVGWVDLSWNLSPAAAGSTCTGLTATAASTANAPWLRTLNSAGTAYDANPTARARFGVRTTRRALYIQDR